jgi:hypothetical protein
LQRKYLTLTILAIILIVAGVLEYSDGAVSGLLFNEMKYDYSSHVLIPANYANGSSLGGYYTVNGTGHNFNMLMILTGGANDTSNPLDYTSSGLHVNGHIDMIKVTPETLIALYQNNMKAAMFGSIFNGNLNMTCSVWNGTSHFQNNGHKLNGTFTITGTETDWYGNYTITNSNGNLVLVGNYLYYPVNQPDEVLYIQKTFYL